MWRQGAVSMNRRVIFYGIIGILGASAGVGDWRLFCHGWSVLDQWCYGLLFVLAPAVFVVPHTIADYLPLWLVRLLGRVGGYYFFAAYYLMVCLLPFVVLKLLFLMPVLAPWGGTVLQYYAWIVAIATVILWVGGIYQGHHQVVRHLEVETAKAVPRDFTVVFASDIHLGVSLGPAFARRLVHDINALKPDVILVGGDIIDGDLQTVLREKSLQALSGLQAPWGVYAVLGNHDHYGFDVNLLKAKLQENGIHVLSGETEQLAEGVALTGVLDALYHSREHVVAGPADDFHIVMEHEPVHMTEVAAAGGDLYFAGHTHAGQFWPNRIMVRRAFPFDYGVRLIGRLTAIVSSGYGAWGERFRVGPPPEIVVVQVKSRSCRDI